MKSNNKGFTLLELLVALSIIGLCMFAFFRIIDTSTKVNTKNDRDIKALNIGQSEIENLRNQVKLKGENEYLEIKNVINPQIDKPGDSDINEEGIKIPINEDEDGDIKWIKSDNEYILQVKDNDYTNKKDIEKDKEKIKANSLLVYKKRSSDDRLFEVELLVKRKKVFSNNKTKDTGIYEYKIDVDVKSEDKYFSKKNTDIEDVLLLSGKTGLIGDSTNPEDPNLPKPPIEELPGDTVIDQHHEIIMETESGYFCNNLNIESYRGRFIQRNKNNVTFDETIQEKPFKGENVKVRIEYKSNAENKYNIMKIIVTDNNGKVTESYYQGDQWYGAQYTPYTKIKIVTRGKVKYYPYPDMIDSGVKLRNVTINGHSVGDITGSKVYNIKNHDYEAIIEFDGFVKTGVQEYDADHTKVFFIFE